LRRPFDSRSAPRQNAQKSRFATPTPKRDKIELSALTKARPPTRRRAQTRRRKSRRFYFKRFGEKFKATRS
jgi:hypothetical protein